MSTNASITTISVINIINDLNHAYTELAYHNGVLTAELAKGQYASMDVVTATEIMIKLHSQSFQKAICQLFEFKYVAVPTTRMNQYGTSLFKAVAI